MSLIILPACGTASRIGHIPKFLLPISSTKSLLNNILTIVTPCSDNVWLSTRPEYTEMVYNYTKSYKLNIKATETNTMSETIDQYKIMGKHTSTIMMMPDTFISDVNIITKIETELKQNDIAVCVWKIQDYQRGKLGQCLINEDGYVMNVVDKDKTCSYDYAWGCIGWNPEFWNYVNVNDSHIGYGLNPAIKNGLKIKAIFMDGVYTDCGTIEEYSHFLSTQHSN